MSILIKGTKKPTYCKECPFVDEYMEKCRLRDEEYSNWGEEYAHCPIIEVPPHGRLIDADVLKACWKDTFFEEMVQILIQTVPAVIHADKDGET